MTTTLRLLLLSTFLVFVLSAPNFFLIDTGVDWQDEQVKEVASPQEESKERNDADYQRATGRGGGWSPNGLKMNQKAIKMDQQELNQNTPEFVLYHVEEDG